MSIPKTWAVEASSEMENRGSFSLSEENIIKSLPSVRPASSSGLIVILTGEFSVGGLQAHKRQMIKMKLSNFFMSRWYFL